MLPLKPSSGSYTLAMLSLFMTRLCFGQATGADHGGSQSAARVYSSADTTNQVTKDVGIAEPAPVHARQIVRVSARPLHLLTIGGKVRRCPLGV